MSQFETIKKHLQCGRSITAKEAISLYSIYRLAARILECRKQGMIIESKMISRNGKNFAKYFLLKCEKVE